MKDYSKFKFFIKKEIEGFPGSERETRKKIRTKLGIGTTWLSRLENAKIGDSISLSYEQLVVISNCLNCTIESLLNPESKVEVMKSLPLKKTVQAAA